MRFEYITVKSSHYAADLQVLKSRLESEGIECFLNGELSSQVLNHIPSMQTELKVHNSDFEKVKAILVETGEWREGSKIVCPECGSEKYRIKRTIKDKWKLLIATVVAAITMTPLNQNLLSSRLVCERCETEFRE
jgi:hypothetical protein